MFKRYSVQGFSLIELMVVVVIVALLAGIAIPAYRKQVQKSNRSVAKAALLDLASREEKYYSINYNYTSTLSLLFNTTTTMSSFTVPSSGPGLYSITAAFTSQGSSNGVVTPGTFTLTAAPVPGSVQATDACGSFILTNTGAQSVNGSGSGCW